MSWFREIRPLRNQPDPAGDSALVQAEPAAAQTTESRTGGTAVASLLIPAYCFATVILIIRLLTAGRYGYFRDELYFLACGEHLGWGYVDHAPLIGLIAWLTRALFGDSLYSLRLFPALASAVKMLLIGGIVRELGGRRIAVTLACLGWLAAPAFLIGDEFGWPEMVDAVSQIYHHLPPDQQTKTAIFTNNYGEAGAIDFFGPRHGLPKAISAHQTYYFWGPRGYTGESVIVLQWDRARAEEFFTNVEAKATLDPPFAMDEERYTIYLCSGMRRPLAQVWPELRH